ncbi:uncharacterized protein PITG_04794 [Phytophthora infestans T30-4]|uniref:K Homology domain-containing protein n=1 Tax=Phytophthora infestans (strain T30-4) TaxID=403677 RepID=D0N222_PHYIT|nr:uncharacterized protein PITG_04794 [Phytophthora infestans T30-4]EEY68351.1 conserved hypothetical protein [Phytophthora infestans T30-4]|eukprot:XP_002905510.1 conserved hypothetical protein [Phytophthora infestans T30-4]
MITIRRSDSAITLKGPTEEVAKVRTIMEDKIQELLRSEEEFRQRRSSRYQQETEEQEDEDKKTSSARDAEASDENSQPNAQQQQRQPSKRVSPVGGTPTMGDVKLTKNQRRRMRKRAENEKSDVLSMLVGNGQGASTTKTTTTTGSNGGYYHSSSGYSLRL